MVISVDNLIEAQKLWPILENRIDTAILDNFKPKNSLDTTVITDNLNDEMKNLVVRCYTNKGWVVTFEKHPTSHNSIKINFRCKREPRYSSPPDDPD